MEIIWCLSLDLINKNTFRVKCIYSIHRLSQETQSKQRWNKEEEAVEEHE